MRKMKEKTNYVKKEEKKHNTYNAQINRRKRIRTENGTKAYNRTKTENTKNKMKETIFPYFDMCVHAFCQ